MSVRYLAVLFSLFAANIQASVVGVFTERATDVLLEFTGSIDTSAFSGPIANTMSYTSLGGGGIAVGPGSANGNTITYIINDFFVPVGGGYTAGTDIGGEVFALFNNGSADQIRLDAGYVSGSPIHAIASFLGSFASLGINPASDIVMNLQGDQTVTLQFTTEQPVIEPAAETPLPGSALLLLSGLLGRAFFTGRRRSWSSIG